MADLQRYIDEARRLCGPIFRVFSESTERTPPDLEPVRETPPSAQHVSATLIRAGCTSVATWTPSKLVGYGNAGWAITAVGTASGWLLTGGPGGLLNYGVTNAAALERFPEVLASVQEHAERLQARDRR